MSGYPSVISQEARAVFGNGVSGNILFAVVQTSSALILYTGANTSFNGFPFLANFVAGDSFLPRQLTKRGHRLGFSNGIMVLAVISIVLILATGAHVDSLVPLYAIGVFTGFTMAGFGMAKYHRVHRESGWRHKLAINGTGGAMSLLVVLIFAIVKFTEGAWVVVILFPILVFALIRLHQKYDAEDKALTVQATDRSTFHTRHLVFIFVDNIDLATREALRYGRGLHPSALLAVHFMVDSARAELLQSKWLSLEPNIDLEVINCPDRRINRAAVEFVDDHTNEPGTEVTVLLPRRTYSPLLSRLLHDRTADSIARALSRLPHATATIIPFDTRSRLIGARRRRHRVPDSNVEASTQRHHTMPEYVGPPTPGDTTAMGALEDHQVTHVEGRIRSIDVRAAGQAPVLVCQVCDASGQVNALFYGRRQITGIQPDTVIRLKGRFSRRHGVFVISNPAYELVADAEGAGE